MEMNVVSEAPTVAEDIHAYSDGRPKEDLLNMELKFETFDIAKCRWYWNKIKHASFGAEECFFNCKTEEYKLTVREHLNDVEFAMVNYSQCVFVWLQLVCFVEKRQPVPPLSPGAFCNDAVVVEDVPQHADIIRQIKQFEESYNIADLIGLRHKVEVMKEYVAKYVKINRENTEKYIVDSSDPEYTECPAWMFFPLELIIKN